MKKYLFAILVLVFFILGCSPKPQTDKKILAKVNNYEIGLNEFNDEFNGSIFAKDKSAETKRNYLENIINRKLILQDAQKKGLDKDPEFLRTIERFWEQSLLKVALDLKTKELSEHITVTAAEVKAAYDKLVKEGRTTKSFEEARGQILWEITKEKEMRAVSEWLKDLTYQSKISINNDLLK